MTLQFSQLFRKFELIRMVLGIMIVINGYPLIFFFKETLHLAPGSTVFTAAVMAMGFLMMIPVTAIRKLYKPNVGLLQLALMFLGISLLYMFFYPDAMFQDTTKDIINYLYIVAFFVLLLNVPNDIIEVFIPVVIAFTVVSNLALVYAMVTDPTWRIGQRAAINYGESEDRQGNPHVFARNAFMCVVACGIWATRPDTGFIPRLLAFFSCVFSMAILVMTQTRSSILALGFCIALFILFNFRPAQIKAALKGLVSPGAIIFFVFAFMGVSYFMQKNGDVIATLYGYFVGFIENNTQNVYALLGIKQNNFVATFDASAGNRATSFGYLRIIIEGHQKVLLIGQGYKSFYMDVPILEALINQGMLGFATFASFVFITLFYCLKAMKDNPDPLTTFLAYFFILLLVQTFTNGRPYEIFFWHPFCLMIRFMGISHLFPAHLRNHPGLTLAT